MADDALRTIPDQTPLLRIVGVSKNIGALAILQQVSFEIYTGEVLGIAGRSGSGISMLAELLAGFHVPDEGELFFAGIQRRWPVQMRLLGIEVILQRMDMAETIDITSNIFLGREIVWPDVGRWFIRSPQQQMDEQANRILAQLGLQVSSLRENAANLSEEQRQVLAIARAMVRPAKLIVVDDPSAVLSRPYQKKLLALIQSWQAQGTAVLFNSDNLDHLFAVTDRIIVLREGRLVANHRVDQSSREEIVAAMVGTPGSRPTTPIIWALDSYFLARNRAEKLRQTQVSLEKDLAKRNVQNTELIRQLDEQVMALDNVNRALQHAHRRLLTEREEERKYLAREIHDEEIQDLLSIGYRLTRITATDGLPQATNQELGLIRDDIRVLVENLRLICRHLRPPTIDHLGLGAAISSLAHEWSNRTNIPVALNLDSNLGRLPEHTELSVFRVVQEALNNIGKHAEAAGVQIHLKHTSPRTLKLIIIDDGQGLPDSFNLSTLSTNGHYGLLGISERVALLGGRLTLRNQSNGGLSMQVDVPHPRSNQ